MNRPARRFQRRSSRESGQAMQGRIHRLIRGKGFGFIQTEDRQYFFHHSEVRDIEFRRLTLGDVVEFQGVEEAEGKNPRATEIHVIQKAERPPAPSPSPARAASEAGPSSGSGPRPRSRPGPRPGQQGPRPGRRPQSGRRERSSERRPPPAPRDRDRDRGGDREREPSNPAAAPTPAPSRAAPPQRPERPERKEVEEERFGAGILWKDDEEFTDQLPGERRVEDRQSEASASG